MFGFRSRIGPKLSNGLGFWEICVEPSITSHILTKSTKKPKRLNPQNHLLSGYDENSILGWVGCQISSPKVLSKSLY